MLAFLYFLLLGFFQDLSSKDDICDLLPSVPIQTAQPQEEFYLKLHRKNSDVPGTQVKTGGKGSSSVRSGRVGQPRRDGQLHRVGHTSNEGHNGHHSYVDSQSYVNRENLAVNVSRSDKDFLTGPDNHAAKNHGGFFAGEPMAALGHPKGVVRVRVNGHSVGGRSSYSTSRKHRENPPNHFNHRTHPESTKGGRRYDESDGRSHTCICVNGPRERTVAAIRIAVEAAAAATADRGWRPEQGGGAKYLDSSSRCKYEPEEDLRPVRKGTLR